jgi:predicted Zn-dependent protease
MNSEQELREEAEQRSLEALVMSLKAGPDAGLALLADRVDPSSIRRKLIILLQAERAGEAADLVRGQTVNELWCELAVQAFVLNGEIDEGEATFQASQKFENLVKRDRCAFALAEALYEHVFRNRKPGTRLSPQLLDSAEKAELARVQGILDPMLRGIEKSECVDSEFKQTVVELAVNISHLVGERKKSEELAKLLSTRTPISLLLPEALLGGRLKHVPENLVQRLLSDHPDSFEAKLMAAALEASIHKNAARGFELAKDLIPIAKGGNQELRLCQALDTFAAELDETARMFVDEQAHQLLAGNRFETQLRTARKLLRVGKSSEARTILEEIRQEDDFLWQQLFADVNLKCGEKDEAVNALRKAASLRPCPETYGYAAEVAFGFNKLEIAAELIQQQLSLDPEDLRARSNLAFIYLNMEEYRKAAQEFSVLQSLQPAEPAHQVNRAESLGLAGEADLSLEVYRRLCASENPPVQAFVGCAKLLRAKGKPEAGFQILQAVKEQYWQEPLFVGTFMDLAHAAQEDGFGHEALVRLQELQSEGKIEGALLLLPFDEIKGQFQEFRKKKEEVLRLSSQGILPWLLVEHMIRRVPYWGWYTRTQPIDWLPDDPLIRAEFGIYSTNFFFVRRGETEKGTIEEISCSAKGQPVALDLSALITLERLELLDQAATYFGRLFIPAGYVARILEDSNRLVPHQKSQKASLVEIKRLVDQRKIAVLEHSGQGAAIPRVSEYTLAEEVSHSYKLCDVTDVLLREGHISDNEYQELLKVAQRPSGVDNDHPVLKPGEAVLAELSTLRTLHTVGLLDPFTACFEVHISIEDRDQVFNEVRGFDALENVHRWHSEMWQRICKDPRFVQVSTKPRIKQEGETDRDIYMLAYFLAGQRNIPVMADDRACQTIALNERQQYDHSSFGTDKLLEVLAGEGMLTADEFAEAYLKLISWRYRFLVVPKHVLKHFALQYLSNPPGKPLREIANYVHDSMRDPGLLAGFEATDPPTTIGSRLLLKWSEEIVQFLIDLWKDEGVPEDKAELITKWAIRELLPSPPRTMGPLKAEVITSLLPRTVINHALFFSLEIKESPRANRALMTIAQALAVTPEEYSRFLAEVIHGI